MFRLQSNSFNAFILSFYLVSRMQSIRDMEKLTNTVADINMDAGINLDLKECDLDDLNLIKEVILR